MNEPLFLLPGLLCDATIWEAQTAAFRGGRQVVVPEYGNATTFAAMASAVLDQAPARFALAGHSMGARIALEVMRLAPQRVTRLALLDTGSHPVQPGEEARRMALLETGRREGMARLVASWLPPMVHPDRWEDDQLMAPLREMAMRPGTEGFARQIGALLQRPDVTSLLGTITCPVLVGVGAEDRWSPPAQHEAIAATMASSTLVIFPHSGHMAPAEAPAAVNEAIAGWLAAPVPA
ncbi:MAG: alpha/beta fold hydrolase [Janthinobacterium lividum]